MDASFDFYNPLSLGPLPGLQKPTGQGDLKSTSSKKGCFSHQKKNRYHESEDDFLSSKWMASCAFFDRDEQLHTVDAFVCTSALE